MSKFCVYTHHRPDGSVFYVGKGSLAYRRHKKTGNRNNHWHNIVKKHGGFESKIVCSFDDEESALRVEEFLIASLRHLGASLANICNGGKSNSGPRWSDDAKAAKSLKMAGKKPPECVYDGLRKKLAGVPKTEEHRKKLSAAKIGTKNPKIWKRVYCITTGKEYESLKQAGFDTGFDISHISKCCLGKINKIHGHEFRYI